MNQYLTAVIDWAQYVGTPTADRLAMRSADLQGRARDVVAPGAGLAEAMGAPWQPIGQMASDTVAEDVLRRTADALATLGEDIDSQTIGVGLDAAERVIKAHARAGQSSPSTALMSGIFTDDVDGREHDHSGAPPKVNPPRGWPCCKALPGQRPTEYRLHDARYGADAPMTIGEADVLRADYAAEAEGQAPA